MTADVEYDIERAGSLKSMFFGGEGLFLATLEGPGIVWMQTLPFSRLCDRIISSSSMGGGSSKGEGSVLGGLGRLVGRTGIESAFLWQPLNIAPLLIALAYDLFVCRRVYTLIAVGLVVHLFRLNADHFVKTELWLPIGRTLVAPFR
jgi:hypothetical protein